MSMWSSGDNIVYGPNRMWTNPNLAGTSSGYNDDEDGALEQGESANFIRIEDGPGIGELVLVKETVNTLQPIDDGTTGEHIDSTTDGVNDYKGNNAIRAYNFLIEDTSNQMRLSQGVEDIGETDKVAVSMKTLKAVKEDLEDQIAAISGGGDAYLTKAEAETTYETILSHASDKQTLESSISSKANSADVYTKAQVDSSLSAKADASTTYTKSEVDSALSSKANSSDVYTKAQTNALIPDVSAYFPKESPEDEDHNVSELVWDQTKFAIKTAESVAAEIVLDAVHSKIETPELIAHGALTATRCLVDTLCMAGAHSSNTEVKYIVVDDDYDAKKNSQTFDKQKAIATFKTMVEKYYDKNESYNKDEVDNLIDGATGEPETTKRYQINTSGTYQASEGFHKGDLAIEAVRSASISDNDYNKSTYRSIWEPIFVVQLYDDEEVFTEPEYLFNWVLTLDIPGKDDSPYTFNMKYEPALDSSGNVIENTWLLVTNDNKTSIVDERITYSYSLRAYHGHDYSVADERDVEWRIGSYCDHAGDSNYESSGLWRSIYHNVSSKRMSFQEKLELYYNLLDNRYLNLENSTNTRRIAWDGTGLYLQSRAQTTDAWTNKILISPNAQSNLSYISVGRILLNNTGSNTGDSVTSILTSSTSAISSSNTAIATGGYVDEFYALKSQLQANYYDKSDVDAVRSAIEAAADARYVQIANVGSLTLPSTINISYTTIGENVIFESSTFMMDSNGLILHESRYGSGPQYAANFLFEAGKTYTGTVTITNETTNWKAANITYMGFKYPTQSESQITFTRNGNVLSFTYTPDRDYTVEGFTFECDPRVTVSETSAGATMRLVQGTRTITVVDTLENYIRYIIAHPQ